MLNLLRLDISEVVVHQPSDIEQWRIEVPCSFGQRDIKLVRISYSDVCVSFEQKEEVFHH